MSSIMLWDSKLSVLNRENDLNQQSCNIVSFVSHNVGHCESKFACELLLRSKHHNEILFLNTFVTMLAVVTSFVSIFLHHFSFDRFIRTLTLSGFLIKFTTISTTYLGRIIVEVRFKFRVFLCSQVYRSNLLCVPRKKKKILDPPPSFFKMCRKFLLARSSQFFPVKSKFFILLKQHVNAVFLGLPSHVVLQSRNAP